MDENETPFDEHASAQLFRIPTAAGSNSCRTRSRMSPKVVDLTSFDVLDPMKLNHGARPLPLAELDEGVIGDFAGEKEEGEGPVELPGEEGVMDDSLAIGDFKSYCDVV